MSLTVVCNFHLDFLVWLVTRAGTIAGAEGDNGTGHISCQPHPGAGDGQHHKEEAWSSAEGQAAASVPGQHLWAFHRSVQRNSVR